MGSPSETMSAGVGILADGELANGNDALGLETDVHENLVALNLNNVPLTRSPSSKSVIVPSIRLFISSSVDIVEEKMDEF